MAIQKITYDNKVAINVDSTIPDINKCNASDLNQIKSVVNNNADEVPTKTSQLTNDSNFITPTDYATTQKGGVFKTETTYGTGMTNGMLRGVIAQDGQTFDGGSFLDASLVSKGSLKKWVDYKGFINKDVNNLTNYTKTSDLSAVATSGDYDDLTNKPTIPSISDEYGTSTTDGYSQNYLNENTLNPNGEATTTSENTSFTLTDTLEAPLLMDLKGNTQQTGTPTPSSPIPVNVVSGDNEILITNENLKSKGTIYNYSFNASSFTSGGNRTLCIPIEANTTYYIKKTMVSNRFRICLTNGKPDTNPSVNEYSDVSTLTETQITNTNYTYLNVFFWTSSDTYTEQEIYNSLNIYTQGTTYNIDLPVENLLNNILTTQEVSGITFTKNTDGSVSISGTATADIIVQLTNNMKFLKVGNTYTLSGCASGGSLQAYRLFVRGTSIVEYGDGITFTLQQSVFDSSNGIAIGITNGTNIQTPILFKPQIELGSKVNTFTPYGTTPIELNKIGNYQDYFYKQDDKWYLHKEVGKYIIDGSESVSVRNSGTSNWLYAISTKSDIPTSSQTSQLCNYYNNSEIFNGNTNQGIMLITNGNEIRVRYGTEDTAQNYKNWLSSHNVSLYYIMTTPTNTEITYTPLINQLNTLQEASSYEGTTNINQVNNDLPFIINATVFNDNYNGRYRSLKYMYDKLNNATS